MSVTYFLTEKEEKALRKELEKDIVNMNRRVRYLRKKASKVEEVLREKTRAANCHHHWVAVGPGNDLKCSQCKYLLFRD